MHSEAKQTEILESGAEKGLLQGHAKRWVAPALKSPELPKGFQQSTFQSQVKEGAHRICDQLVHNSLTG